MSNGKLHFKSNQMLFGTEVGYQVKQDIKAGNGEKNQGSCARKLTSLFNI